MEPELWTAKYQHRQQQSVTVAGSEEKNHNNNNNDEDEDDGNANDDASSFIKIEPGQEKNCSAIIVSERAKRTIELILEQIKSLSPVEKFLLFLKLPSEVTNAVDPFRQPLNPLGNRLEIYKTISWIKTHLEEDPDISLPKQEVYNDYYNYCEKSAFKPLSQADFGKVMKQVYPKVRARRLGTRGNSRYCYSGLRRCVKLKPPVLPDLTDKPMSTEAPFTQASLNSAAWLIIKDWSEQRLGKRFPNIHSLAYHLILNHSVGHGSHAATQITTAASETSSKDDVNVGNKHKEMQIQLQKKIQQRSEGKERKRKIQSQKSESKPSSKKSRSQSLPVTCTGVSPPNTASVATTNGNSTATTTTNSSNSNSPTQNGSGKAIICDKTQLASLPEFKSLQQKHPPTQPATTNQSPRLQGGVVQGAVVNSDKGQAPPPAPYCDIAAYNPRQEHVEGERSQEFSNDLVGISKVTKNVALDDEDGVLTRERINSVSIVDKDAMDEYLGTNNSQHEEELSKYFNNNVSEVTDKLSTLRQLLEQNGIVIENKPEPTPLAEQQTYIAPTVEPTTYKRRVSFETSLIEEAVPPSPNTRRKNFSFTPISPGPHSPGQSKGSSTTVSPFVSPRNTPVLKTNKKTSSKVKREIDLTIDIPPETGHFGLPMSAPASPMLKKLLNSGSKLTYNPGYNVQSVPLTPETNFFPKTPEDSFRSQSVPVPTVFDISTIPSAAENIFNVDIPSNVPLIDTVDAEQFLQNYQLTLNPSRSVPCTPVPFNIETTPKPNYARSYPSTPLNHEEGFTYNINSDCLLNGQPIRSNVSYEMPRNEYEINGGEFQVGVEGQEFNIIENDASLIDNCVLMEQSYGNIN